MKPKFKNIISPISLPVIFFLAVILIGAFLLHCSFSYQNDNISFIDAFFTSTSAVCVTGLAVFDTGSKFTRIGQTIIIILIQLGGLGIMTFSSLAYYLLKNKVSLTDRIAVGQSLLHDSKFHLGRFLIQIIAVTFVIESTGAVILYLLAPADSFSPFSALFHSISAFCNAGFSLNNDSLIQFRDNWSINLTIMFLIIIGGLGFSVLIELRSFFVSRVKKLRERKNLSWHSSIVLRTTFFLIITGWIYIYFAEFISFKQYLPVQESLLASLFQSVTCRTAGFNTLNISNMTNASLVFMIFLMLIGGAPGSCAGGIKVTTFRVLAAFISCQIKGRDQVIIEKYAVNRDSINKTLTLLFFSLVIIGVSVVLLDISEGGDTPHTQARGQFLEILFEVVSAFGTVGLSTGITAKLSSFGKIIIVLLMFIGRLGPLVLLASIQSFRTKVLFSRPEEKISIG